MKDTGLPPRPPVLSSPSLPPTQELWPLSPHEHPCLCPPGLSLPISLPLTPSFPSPTFYSIHQTAIFFLPIFIYCLNSIIPTIKKRKITHNANAPWRQQPLSLCSLSGLSRPPDGRGDPGVLSSFHGSTYVAQEFCACLPPLPH